MCWKERTAHRLLASITPAASLAKRTSRAFTASITPAGSLARTIGRSLTSALGMTTEVTPELREGEGVPAETDERRWLWDFRKLWPRRTFR